jgi:hypothetical protein
MQWSLIAGVTALLAASAASFGFAQMTRTTIAIEKMEPGQPPKDFDFGRTGQGTPGKWQVVADATAAGGLAIEQASTDRTDHRFPLAVYQGVVAKNVEVTLRFKALDGKVDRASGIAVRVTDPNNYYVVRANALEDNVRFYKVAKGQRIQIAGANLKVSAGDWHLLGLRAQGDSFTISFDGRELYRATDNSIYAAGKIALWTKADSVTRFDQIQIEALHP